MTEYRYGRAALLGDAIRSTVGLVCTFGPLAAIEMGTVMALIFAAAASLFAIFGLRVLYRCVFRVRLDDTAVTALGLRPAIVRWSELAALSLRYYTTKRDGSGGWMQLRLRGGGGSISIESTLDGFLDIVRRASRAAEARGLVLTATTVENLRRLGVGVANPGAQP